MNHNDIMSAMGTSGNNYYWYTPVSQNKLSRSIINNEEVIAMLSSCIKMELFLVTVFDLIEGSLKISIQ